jgi:hypothetical protein
MEYPVCNWNRVVSKSQGRVLEKEVTKEYFSKKKKSKRRHTQYTAGSK